MTRPTKRTNGNHQSVKKNGRKESDRMKPSDWIGVSEKLVKLGGDVVDAKREPVSPSGTGPKRKRTSN